MENLPNVNSMTMVELQTALHALDIDATGSRRKLVARLETARGGGGGGAEAFTSPAASTRRAAPASRGVTLDLGLDAVRAALSASMSPRTRSEAAPAAAPLVETGRHVAMPQYFL